MRREVSLAVHMYVGVGGSAASLGSPAWPPLPVAGVKSWLEAGEQGQILSVDRGNMMACQICSSLICLVTVTSSSSRTWAKLYPPVWKRLVLFAVICLMKNAAAHCLVHGIGFSSEFSGLAPGEGQIRPLPAPCEGTGGLNPIS